MKNNKVIYGTWKAYDTYEKTMPIDRWVAFTALLKGKIKVRYQLPHDSKRKGIYLKGKKVDRFKYEKTTP